jgi:hypothetical protein
MQRLAAIAERSLEIAEILALPSLGMRAALRRVALPGLDRVKALRNVAVVG